MLRREYAGLLSLYPLRFTPQFDYRPWGGRRLASLLGTDLPGDAPVGEAWLLSDRAEYPSVVAEGPLQGTPLRSLVEQYPAQLLGAQAARRRRFPLLLKFLDVTGTLSVQVHPSDAQLGLLPPGESGKTEAWVVLDCGSDARIYAGLKPQTTRLQLGSAIAGGTVAATLASFAPEIGDALLIPAGTVHCLRDLLVFEVQENSDVTYRLYDWGRVDARTQAPRPLQVEQALASVDFTPRAIRPATPVVESGAPLRRERLLGCEYFGLSRVRAQVAFGIGREAAPHILVCIDGRAQVIHDGRSYRCTRGDTLLVPAAIGPCRCVPQPTVELLEVTLPPGA